MAADGAVQGCIFTVEANVDIMVSVSFVSFVSGQRLGDSPERLVCYFGFDARAFRLKLYQPCFCPAVQSK